MKKLNKLMVSLVAVAILGCEKPLDVAQAPKVPESRKLSPLAISENRPSFMQSQPFALGGKCNMEKVNGVAWDASAVEVDVRKPLLITGWAVDDEKKMHPKEIFLRIQDGGGKEYYLAANSIDRPEVAEYFKADHFLQSGYSVVADIQSLSPDTYTAMVVMDVGGKSVLCANGRSFVVKGGA